MPVLDFSSIDIALAEAKKLANITNSDSDDSITTILEASAGTDSQGNKVYRPYLAGALQMYQITIPPLIARSFVYQAKGVSFALPRDLEPAMKDTLRGFLLLQQGLDCKLKIDPCWNAKKFLKDMGLEENKKYLGVTGIVSASPF
jgi:hypothetical protein